MLYKQNFEETKKMMQSFWNKEYTGRCPISVVAPKSKERQQQINSRMEAMKADNLERYWTDIDFVLSSKEEMFENTCYIGEAIPNLSINLGPGVVSTCYGSELIFNPDTIWFTETIKDWDKDFKKAQTNRWIDKMYKMTQAAVDAGRDKYVVSTTDMGGAGDILAILRGSQSLCFDLIEQPEVIKHAISDIKNTWVEVFEKQLMLLSKYENNSSSRLMWSSTRHYPMQCDFSAMLSPEMYSEFFLPEITELCNHMDNAMYHLDGPDAVRHVDALMTIDSLKAIQWVPGTGNDQIFSWLPMLRKIQEHDKHVLVYLPSDKEMLKAIFETLRADRMYAYIGTDSPEKAEEIFCYVTKLCKNQKLK